MFVYSLLSLVPEMTIVSVTSISFLCCLGYVVRKFKSVSEKVDKAVESAEQKVNSFKLPCDMPTMIGFGLIFCSFATALYAYRRCLSPEVATGLKKKVDKRWNLMKKFMIFSGLVTSSWITGNADMNLFIANVLAKYRDSKIAIEMIDSVVDLFSDDDISRPENKSDDSDSDDDEDESKYDMWSPQADDDVKSPSLQEDVAPEWVACITCADGEVDANSDKDRCNVCILRAKKAVRHPRQHQEKPSEQLQKIDTLVESGQLGKRGLGFFSTRPADVFARLWKRLTSLWLFSFLSDAKVVSSTIKQQTVDTATGVKAGLFSVGNKIQQHSGKCVVGGLFVGIFLLCAVFYPVYTRKSEGGKTKKRHAAKKTNMRTNAKSHAIKKPPHDESGNTTNQFSRDEQDLSDKYAIVAGLHDAGYDREVEQVRVDHAVVRKPRVYRIKAVRKNVPDRFVCAFTSNDCLIVPRHGVAGAEEVYVCIDNVWLLLDKKAYRCKSIVDQLWFKLPVGSKKVRMNKYRYRKPVPQEQVVLHWVDTDGLDVYASGRVAKELTVGKDGSVPVFEFDGSSKAGACGGVYIAESDGKVVGFHGIGSEHSSAKPLFYPPTAAWCEELEKQSHGICDYEVLKDVEYEKVFNGVVNKRTSISDLKYHGSK